VSNHSTWSPSKFKQIMLCPGSTVLQAGAPRKSSFYADEGTAAHLLLTRCLNEQAKAADHIGESIAVLPAGAIWAPEGYVTAAPVFTVDEDMARHVQVTLDYVADIMGDDGILLVDRKVHFGGYIGQPDEVSFGTLDVAVLRVNAKELVPIDFKYGMGVLVDAGADIDFGAGPVGRAPNPQLALYGLGILTEVVDLMDVERVRLVISQPRTSVKPSEYDLPAADLIAWGTGPARVAAEVALTAQSVGIGDELIDFLHPGDEQCRFCQAAATCPALRKELQDAVGIAAASPADFTPAAVPGKPHIEASTDEWLSASMKVADRLEAWCKAVRAEVERRLLAGAPVPDFKLVQGRQGNRAWSDVGEATKLLREVFRLPVEKAFDMSLISPTSAEKLAKAGDIGPRQWPKAEKLIIRAPGKPHVAPADDPRAALTVTTSADFTPDTTGAEDFS